MGTQKPPKVKVVKKYPDPSTNTTGKGGMTPDDTTKALKNRKIDLLKQVIMDGDNKDKIAEMLADPKKMEKMLPLLFGNLVSFEKIFGLKDALNPATRNTLLGLGKGDSGGYGGPASEGYLQLKPIQPLQSKDPRDPTLDPSDPTKNKSGRIDGASNNNKFIKVSQQSENNKFIKVSQQSENNEYEFLKVFENPDSIAEKMFIQIENQNKINPSDEAAFAKIVNSYQRTYTNKLKEFFSDSDEGQKILGKITPKK